MTTSLFASSLRLALLATTSVPAPAHTPLASPCTFGRDTPLPAGSTLADQFRCYQNSGRHLSLVGHRSLQEGLVSGGVCVLAVAADRVQLAPCRARINASALTLPFAAIAYLVDDPREDAVNIYLAP